MRDEHPFWRSRVNSINGRNCGDSCGHLCAGHGWLPVAVRAEEDVGECNELVHVGDKASLGCWYRVSESLCSKDRGGTSRNALDLAFSVQRLSENSVEGG